MNKLIKRYIILFFVIIIPLVAAYLVGSYGFKSEKFGQGKWLENYREVYFTTEDVTTEKLIDKYLKYGINAQYFIYDQSPIYSEVLKNENGENLLNVDIYRSIYKTIVNEKTVDRVQYLYFIYNVQYLKIRDLFNAEGSLKDEIVEANVPSISMKIQEVYDDGEQGATDTLTLIPSKMIADYDADVDFVSGGIGQKKNDDDELVYVVVGFNPLKELDWSTKVKLEVVATVKGIKDNNNQDITTSVGELEVDNYEVDPEKVDITNYTKSYEQDLNNAGYFKWIFAKKLWWISLIAFVAVGSITGSFYLVYKAEEENVYVQNKKSRK